MVPALRGTGMGYCNIFCCVYRCMVKGDPVFFCGQEDILKDGEVTYTCYFHERALLSNAPQKA